MKKHEEGNSERGKSCEIIMIHHGSDSNQNIVPEHILERDRKQEAYEHSNQNIVPEHILERDRKQEAYERGFKDPPSHPHRRLTTFETEEFCERSTKILKKKRSDPKQNCSSKTCPNKLSPLVCPNSTTPNCSRNSSNMSNFMSPLPTPANADQKSSIVGGKTVTTSTETKITFSNEKLF
uniref:Uncharacterized protein n=1 Tax=Panagrolaimus sp. JU765 TaxID=591449 RepID=A0AC34RI38_9BILA